MVYKQKVAVTVPMTRRAGDARRSAATRLPCHLHKYDLSQDCQLLSASPLLRPREGDQHVECELAL